MGHEMVLVGDYDLGITLLEQDISKLHRLWVLACHAHDLVQDHSLLKDLFACSSLDDFRSLASLSASRFLTSTASGTSARCGRQPF